MPQKTTTAKSVATTNGRRRSGAPFVPKVDPSEYSKEHHESIALLPEFFAKVYEQEKMYVAAGFPAEGLTEFLSKWWTAWEKRDVALLRECVTDDLVYADPTSPTHAILATQTGLYDFYYMLFKAAPDLAFWPQDDTKRALPYYDFLNGEVRITVPWRMIARFRMSLRPMNVVGVDRYNMVRDPERGWLIQRIDTDGDMLWTLGSQLPLPLPRIDQKKLHGLVKTLQRLSPKLRGPKLRPMTHDKAF